jgi:hypothetical protein
MVKTEKSTPSGEDTRENRDTPTKKPPVLSCIGNVCFEPNNKIRIEIDSVRDPECAKKVSEYILSEREEDIEFVLKNRANKTDK